MRAWPSRQGRAADCDASARGSTTTSFAIAGRYDAARESVRNRGLHQRLRQRVRGAHRRAPMWTRFRPRRRGWRRARSTNLAALIGTCNTTQAARLREAFLATFPKKAYRRPPTDTEIQRLHRVNAAGATGGLQGGLQLMVEAVLQSPSFLYREELGRPIRPCRRPSFGSPTTKSLRSFRSWSPERCLTRSSSPPSTPGR